jgi:hypothetical protein
MHELLLSAYMSAACASSSCGSLCFCWFAASLYDGLATATCLRWVPNGFATWNALLQMNAFLQMHPIESSHNDLACASKKR